MIIEEKRQYEKTEKKQAEHSLALSRRKKLSVEGVENIVGFSDTSVTLDTVMGRLIIKGEGLHVNKLSLNDGSFALDGTVNSVEYTKKGGKKGSFFENLFR